MNTAVRMNEKYRLTIIQHHITAQKGGNGIVSIALDGSSYASSLVLSLVSQALNDVLVLHGKFPSKNHVVATYPWRIIILSGNLISRMDGLQRCTNLRKLDLSRNGMETIPGANFWKHMRALQILMLHQNKIDSIHALQQLVR
jgi:Leucine-rich repeat (LRR) protein